MSAGKDTTTGHWEMMGVVLQKGFTTFPQGFSDDFMARWLALSGAPGYLGNHTASGTTMIVQEIEQLCRHNVAP